MATELQQKIQELATAARGRTDPAKLALELTRLQRLAAQDAQERGQLESSLARFREVLERALDVTTARGLEPVAQRVIDGMVQVVGAKRGFIGLTDARGRSWRFLVARNMAHEDIDDPEQQVSTTIITDALANRMPVVVDDAGSDDAFSGQASVNALQLRSVACLPLLRDRRPFGFVYLDQPESSQLFDEAALTAVKAWLPLAAQSVGHALDATDTVEGLPGFVTRSQAMRDELVELGRMAAFDVSILVTGETGTGKSMLARLVHDASPRAGKPFLHVNCGAIPEALMEGELFGAEAGAYTGAKVRREGKFEAADGGTLFLDELDTMPMACQVKLLVVLQERTLTRLGSNDPVTVDVRVLAAMSSDPQQAIAEGRLREDLYYRLAVIETRLPALRERKEDIPLLAAHTLERTRERYGLPPLHLSDAALDELVSHDWPGNVRELQNALDRAALYSRNGVIDSLRRRGPSRSTSTSSPEGTGLLEQLELAGRAWVAAVEANPRLQGLDMVDAFRGVVLAEAVRHWGDKDAAFEAMGEGSLVKNRNHHRAFKRELDRFETLKERLGEG